MKRKTRILASILVALMLIGDATVGVVALEGVTDNNEAPATQQELGIESQQSQENQELENGGSNDAPGGGINPEEPLLMANSLPPKGEFSATATKVLPYNIRVEWTDLGEGYSYTVTEKSGLIEEKVLPAPVDPQDAYFEFSDLETGVKYQFVVTANNGEDEQEAETESIELDPQPGQVTGFYTYSSYKRIVLEWNKDKNATAYNIYRRRANTTDYNKIGEVTNKNIVPDKADKVMYTDRKVANDTTYYYYVRAVGTTEEGEEIYEADPSITKSDTSVRRMYIKVTFRYKKRLRSHDAAKKYRTFRKNQTVTAYGYGRGKYRFYYKGNLYHVSYFRVKNAKAYYTTKFNYSTREAEYFVNASGQRSPTKWLIWVNEYTQHLYVFRGSKGKWKIYNHWEIASGKASSPTPKGFNKRIFRKVPIKNGHGPWTCFQSWSSFHGNPRRGRLGRPASGGCVRSTNAKGRWIYRRIPMQTAVIIF